MDLERWTRATRIFDSAVELDGDERADHVARATRDDPDLRSLVERMLASDEAPASVLDRAPGGWPVRLHDGD